MKKSVFLFVLFNLVLSGILFSTSCSKEEEPVLEVDTTSILISNEGSTETLTISANNKWTLSQEGNLILEISALSGMAGETTLSLSAAPNNAPQAKSTTITILSANLSKSVTVSQEALSFEMKVDGKPFDGTLAFGAEGGEKEIAVESNAKWKLKLSSIPLWIESISPTEGDGDANIRVKVKKSENKNSENMFLATLEYASSSCKITITQEKAPNKPPTAPIVEQPSDGSVDVSRTPDFSWTSSTDPDGDSVSYKARISTDNKSWTTFYSGNATSIPFSSTNLEKLNYNTTYYFKVVASDGYNNGNIESEVVEFKTTATRSHWVTGEYECLLKSSKPNPIILTFSGDGYTLSELEYGGKFDTDIEEALEEFFSVEPYKTYKEYFTVYKLAAESNESGVTITSKNVKKETYFQCVMQGGNSTSISCNDKKAFDLLAASEFGKNIKSGNRLFCIIINENTYAGTCITWSNGDCIGMVPVSRSSYSNTKKFGNVLVHEFGGHGIGMLADEYIYYYQTIPENTGDSNVQNIKRWQSDTYCNHYMNISVYGNIADSPWAHFAGNKDYPHVGMFEGAYFYSKGVWRPETISCMDDNRKYFNSPSRFYIVKRILEMAGEVTPTVANENAATRAAKIGILMEKFLMKDTEKTDHTSIRSNTSGGWEGVPYDFVPLAPPIMKVAQ